MISGASLYMDIIQKQKLKDTKTTSKSYVEHKKFNSSYLKDYRFNSSTANKDSFIDQYGLTRDFKSSSSLP